MSDNPGIETDYRPAAVRGRQLITQTLQNLRKDHNA